MALFTASAIGMVIANNASLAAPRRMPGRVRFCRCHGCRCHYRAGRRNTPYVSQAVAIALKNILGLVCDPVAGLVEIPCIKRNASSVAGAFVAAEMALAGIDSAIPADEVIWSMKRIGDIMSPTLKETAEAAGRHTNRKKASRAGIWSW